MKPKCGRAPQGAQGETSPQGDNGPARPHRHPLPFWPLASPRNILCEAPSVPGTSPFQNMGSCNSGEASRGSLIGGDGVRGPTELLLLLPPKTGVEEAGPRGEAAVCLCCLGPRPSVCLPWKPLAEGAPHGQPQCPVPIWGDPGSASGSPGLS